VKPAAGTASSDALAGVRGYLERPEHVLIGVMSGTSADGIDTILVRFRGAGLDARSEVLTHREAPLEPELRREVLELAAVPSVAPERLMRLDAALGERYAAAILELLGAARLDARAVDAVGLHGQTVRHVPRTEGAGQALTLQLGSAAVVAERTGIAVVSGFRGRDIAAGGEGAPLVPILDWWLLRSPEESRGLLNLGGMANLTVLPRGGGLEDVFAFDTGPGNALLDELVGLRSEGRERFDRDGQAAARGHAAETWLAELLADPFFAQPPPRSTGRERFGRAFAQRMRERGRALGLSDDDILATAVELTAASVAESLDRFVTPRQRVDSVYASGGGIRNPVLMRSLARRLGPIALAPVDRLGVPAQGKEALAFAFLAHLTLSGRAGNVPGATGAAHPVVLGQITPGASR
jgi:anhydro-N-acetylmuramic acid kinase